MLRDETAAAERTLEVVLGEEANAEEANKRDKKDLEAIMDQKMMPDVQAYSLVRPAGSGSSRSENEGRDSTESTPGSFSSFWQVPH